MTVAQQTIFNPYTGNGVTTVYPYTFKILAAADVKVYVGGVLKLLNADYTVSGVGADNGGNVTFLAAPANGLRVMIRRARRRERLTDYQNQGDFDTPVVNPDFDNPVLLLQDLAADIGLSIRVPVDELDANMQLPARAARAGMMLRFDANGNVEAALAVTNPVSPSIIGSLLYPQSAAEAGLGVVPTYPQYEWGNVLRYGADPTGVLASDFAFGVARNVTGRRGGYVPEGTYKITGNLNTQGLWGEGTILGLGTQRLYIPRSMQEFSSLQRIYGQLQKVRGWNSMVAMMGDSICEGYDSGPFTGGAISNTWFYRLMQGIMWLTGQIGQPGAVTNFNDPTRYGLNLAGPTALGTRGPVKASLIMSPGSTISFNGQFPRIAVWARQNAGVGKLEFRLNGVLYDTLDFAGALADDTVKTTVANAGTNGAHTITCITANVEISAVLQNVGAPSNTQWPIYMAKSGESSSLYDTTTLDSVRAILKGPNNPTSGRALVFFQMLLNDYLASSPTAKTSIAYRAKLERIFSALTADGHQVIMVLPPRPDEPTRPGYLGETFTPYVTRAREAAEAYGIPVIDVNAYDMNGEGFLPDGVHPNTAGHEQMFRVLIEQLALLDSYSQPYMVGLREYVPDVSLQNSYTARAGWYYAEGGLVHVWGQITINVAVGLGGGALTVTLPIKSANSTLPSGTAGPTFGWAASMGNGQGMNTPAGFTQLVANVSVNGSQLFIRCLDPDSGARNDVASLSNGAVINFYACYPRGE